MSKFKKIIYYCIIIILIFGICYFGKKIFEDINSNNENQKIKNDTISDVVNPDFDDSNFPTKHRDNDKDGPIMFDQDNQYINYSGFLHIDFNKLIQKNKDTVAWIYVPDTNANYPIVKHTDNKFYLNHNFNMKYNNAGWIFGDYRCDFLNLGQNTVIYGHDRKDASMFGDLAKLKNETWFKNEKHKYIYFANKVNSYIFEIVSVYTVKPNSFYNKAGFKNAEEFQKFLNYMEDKNTIKSLNNQIGINDNILTLSTCYGNNRLVIQAKLIAKSIN